MYDYPGDHAAMAVVVRTAIGSIRLPSSSAEQVVSCAGPR